MMTTGSFLQNLGLLLAAMVFLALLETALPFFGTDWRRRHAGPNLALTAMTLSLNLGFNAASVLVTAWLSSRGFGLLASASLNSAATVLVGIVVLDASTYVAHRLMHVLPALWSAHRVHHSDPLVDVTTSLRFHPIETLWRFAFIIAPVWVLGLPVRAVAAYRVVSAFVAIFEHMNVKLWQPLDTALSYVIGTPNMHKIHHSRQPTETNTNYGNIFTLFDRALGTFTPSARAPSVDYGLTGLDDARTQRLGGLLALPFRGSVQATVPGHDNPPALGSR
jgi:sterol desaturase/sphingolipid hydroxylase (fatty acid hydroxylase superfamily)